MKNRTQKRLIILSLLFTVLAGLYLYKENIRLYFEHKPLTAFGKIQPSDISEITLSNETETTSLYKKNNVWYTKQNNTEYKADKSRIQKLTESLASLTKADIVSTNKNKRNEFDIEKQKIVFKANNKTQTLFVGKPTGSRMYVAVDSDPEVFVSNEFNEALSTLDYRDLMVPIIDDENKVSAITLTYDEQNTELRKKNDEWYVNSEKGENDRVNFLLNDLMTLKADDIVSKDSLDGLYSNLKIVIKEGSKEKTAEFYQRDEENYLISLLSEEVIYQIKTAYVQSLKKTQSDLTL